MSPLPYASRVKREMLGGPPCYCSNAARHRLAGWTTLFTLPTTNTPLYTDVWPPWEHRPIPSMLRTAAALIAMHAG